MNEKVTEHPICADCIVDGKFAFHDGRYKQYFSYEQVIQDGREYPCDLCPSMDPESKCFLARKALREMVDDDFISSPTRSDARSWLGVVEKTIDPNQATSPQDLKKYVDDLYEQYKKTTENLCDMDASYFYDPEDATWLECPNIDFCKDDGVAFATTACRNRLRLIMLNDATADIVVDEYNDMKSNFWDAYTRHKWVEFKEKYTDDDKKKEEQNV